MIPQIITIGIYGFDADSFFSALQNAKVDLLCDIRRRRGVRGAQYAFANSKRLQSHLAVLGIGYRHCIDLAPLPVVRQSQSVVDAAQHIAKRERTALDPTFVAAYQRMQLSNFSPHVFLASLPEDSRVIAFLCVEHAPEACHRSLVSALFAQQLGLLVEHIT